jgi:hypothetical protein
MLLPGADRAVVDIVKLRYYCLSPTHPRGRHKARVFAATVGLAAADAEELRGVYWRLRRRARRLPARQMNTGSAMPSISTS